MAVIYKSNAILPNNNQNLKVAVPISNEDNEFDEFIFVDIIGWELVEKTDEDNDILHLVIPVTLFYNDIGSIQPSSYDNTIWYFNGIYYTDGNTMRANRYEALKIINNTDKTL